MEAVHAFLASRAAREQSRTSLADAFLANSWPAYARYRLRFFLLRYALGASAYAVKLGLLYSVFARDHFNSLVAVHAITALFAAFWFGALEEMRGSVRELFRNGHGHRADREVGRWLRPVLAVGSVGLAATCVVATVLSLRGGFGPAHLYLFAVIARLFFELPVRVYHSGMFAVRRIYRPLAMMLVIDLVGLGAVLALTPFLGAWAFGTATILAAVIVNACTLWYTWRAYWFMGLAPEQYLRERPTRGRSRARRRPRRHRWPLRGMMRSGLASAAMSVDGLVLLLLAVVGGADTPLAGLLFALAPSLRATVDWAQLFYFDLKRLEVAPFRNFRRIFQRWTARLAWILGLALWAIGWGLASFVLPPESARAGFWLLPLFIAQSMFAAAQVRAFTDAAYGRIGASTAVQLGIALPLLFFCPQNLAVVALAGACLAAAVPLWSSTLDVARWGRERALPLPLWLHELGARHGDVVRICSARVVPAREVHPREQRRPPGQQEAELLAKRIARGLAGRGLCTVPEAGRVTWFEVERGDRARFDVMALATESVGLLAAFDECRVQGGAPERVAAANHPAYLGVAATPAPSAPALEPGRAAMASWFASHFPEGMSCTPGASNAGVGLRELPPDERQKALAEAVAYARDLAPRRVGSYEVSALCEAGELHTLFLMPLSANRNERLRWRQMIAHWNIAAAAGGQPLPVQRQVPRPPMAEVAA